MCDYKKQTPTLLEIALDARKFELDLFWRRSLFFWGFIASAFVGFASTYSKHPSLAFLISCFGVICTFSWALVNRGSKFWYETWEAKAIENGYDGISDLFEKEIEVTKQKGLLTAKRFSVSKITIALSDFTFVLWLGIFFYQITLHVQLLIECKKDFLHIQNLSIFLAFVLTIGFIIHMYNNGRGESSKVKNVDGKHIK